MREGALKQSPDPTNSTAPQDRAPGFEIPRSANDFLRLHVYASQYFTNKTT